LYGSIELAPLTGLADLIIDIVDTGKTLQANGLVELDTLLEVTSWLIVNKVSLTTQFDRVDKIIKGMQKQLEGEKA
ncbi:MAG: ATP phosphoribosyltransferase, partial [bacterium]